MRELILLNATPDPVARENSRKLSQEREVARLPMYEINRESDANAPVFRPLVAVVWRAGRWQKNDWQEDAEKGSIFLPSMFLPLFRVFPVAATPLFRKILGRQLPKFPQSLIPSASHGREQPNVIPGGGLRMRMAVPRGAGC